MVISKQPREFPEKYATEHEKREFFRDEIQGTSVKSQRKCRNQRKTKQIPGIFLQKRPFGFEISGVRKENQQEN